MARKASLASSSPEMTSIGSPVRDRTAAATSAPFVAILSGHRPGQRRIADRTRLRQTLAESGHLGAIHDRGPTAGGTAGADVKLHGLGPDVDHRIALGRAVEQRRKGAGVADIDVAVQPETRDRADDRGRVCGFDGDRAGGLSVREDVRKLGHAAVDGVAQAPLVDPRDPNATVPTGERCKKSVERVAVGQGTWP